MKIKGHIHRITQPQAFAASYLAKNGKPNTGFGDWGKARVHAVVELAGAAALPGFFPSMSIKADTDSRGRFTVDVPAAFKTAKCWLVAYTQVGSVSVPIGPTPSIAVFGPIYRSEKFALSKIDTDSNDIYVLPMTMPDSRGIPQQDVRDQANAFKKSQKLSSLSVSLSKNDVDCKAEKKGATLTFSIKVTPNTGSELDDLVRVKVENYDLDLPGPDFIVGLCVDEDEIEKKVRKGVRDIGKKMNKLIRDAFLAEFAGSAAFANLVSLTLRQVRFPVTSSEQVKLPGTNVKITVNHRSIVGDPCIGVPRKLY